MYNDIHRLADSCPELFSTNPELTYAGSPYLCRSVGNGSKTYRNICPPFTAQPEEKCDMIKHITKEEKKGMSCVGVMTNDNGIVAFSDSRSCYQFADEITVQNDETKKVFEGRDFVFVQFGLNEVCLEDSRFPIEKIIEETLRNFSGNYREFFYNLHRKIQYHFQLFSDDVFSFIVGFSEMYHGKQQYSREYCYLNRQGATFSSRTYHEGTYLGGYLNFVPDRPAIPRNLPIEKMEEIATGLVETAEKLGDLALRINPVGGSVQIRTLH